MSGQEHQADLNVWGLKTGRIESGVTTKKQGRPVYAPPRATWPAAVSPTLSEQRGKVVVDKTVQTGTMRISSPRLCQCNNMIRKV